MPGVTCFISQARKGGWGQPLGLNEEPSNFFFLPAAWTHHHRHLDASGEGGGVHREDEHLLQGNAHLPDTGREAQRDRLSRGQLEDHRRLAVERDQRRSDHALGREMTGDRTLALRQRNESAELSRLLVPLKRVDEVDVDFCIGEPGLGEPFDELFLERRHVDGPRGNDPDLRPVLGLVHLILLDSAVLPKRRPEHEGCMWTSPG